MNVGCGTKKLKGYVNVDSNPKVNPDVLADLNQSIPFDNNTVDEILCDQVIEHLDNPVSFLCECKRILKDRGILILRFPNNYWWRNKIRFLFNNYRFTTIYSPYHRVLKPSIIKDVLLLLGFEIKSLVKSKGLSGLLFPFNEECRESCIQWECSKKE